MAVTQSDIQNSIRTLGLSTRVICIHSSLRSFGRVDGGASAIIQTFLKEDCTILVPTFSHSFEISPPLHLRFERNGWNYDAVAEKQADSTKVFIPKVNDIDPDMGAISAAVVTHPDHLRGNHPLNSFTALGSKAKELIASQQPLDVYAPLTALVQMNGFILLMGVGFKKMTLFHLAEKISGRTLFRRWSKDSNGSAITVEVGSCSDGFEKFESKLNSITKKINVGQSLWQLLPARKVLEYAVAAIKADPQITHCENPACERCNDSVVGGPVLLNEKGNHDFSEPGKLYCKTRNIVC